MRRMICTEHLTLPVEMKTSKTLRYLITSLAVTVLIVPLVLKAQPAELLRRPEHFERSRDYDALNYRLVFILDVGDKSYRGENTVTLVSLRDGLQTCFLDAEDMTVTGAASPNGPALPYSVQDGKLAVGLPRPLAYGEKSAIVVRFFQKDPKTGLKFFDAAPDHPAQVNTYSWPEDAHHWFPCFDDPIDRVTDEVFATVRSDYKVLSNGRLEGVTEDNAAGTRTWHWTQDKSHPVYCIMLAAAPFEIVKDSLGPLPVDAWVYPKDVVDAPRSFRKTPEMIDFYGRTFGYPYPWSKYDQVCVAGRGGGMEATTATILGQATIHDERADQDFPSDALVAHELAHMWWGDLVTERAWSDVWLSESFATYSEYLFCRHDRGEDEAALNLEFKKDEYLNEARRRYIRPIVFDHYDLPGDIMDAHSYEKGAAVLHMLRFILGDEAFFRTLGAFLRKFAFGNADTHDLMNCVKDTTGQNLDWFLEQWVERPGHPVFDVSDDWDAKRRILRLSVRQVQDSSKGIPVFRTPVIIGIRAGDWTTAEKVWINKAEEVFEFSVPTKPELVRFDDGNFLLKELMFKKPAEELIFQLRNDDSTGRIWAAGELAKYLENPVVRGALRKTAENDAFWAVRRAGVETLSGATGENLEAFLKARCTDANSKVRAAALHALGLTKNPRLAPFFENVFRKDRSYVAQAEALAAIGECGGRDYILFLKEATALTSPRSIVKKSAESAIRKIEEYREPEKQKKVPRESP
jgi:aminopeptidase N